MKWLDVKRMIAYLLFPWLYLGIGRRAALYYRRTPPLVNVNLLIGLIVFSTLSFGGWGSSNNPTINISPTSISVDEGDSGTSTVSLSITASDCPDTSDIKIHWETADVTATTSDNDYAGASGDVTFSVPGWFDSCDDADKNKSISVTVNGDTKFEPDETFKVVISDGGTNSSQDFTIGDSTSTITIKNDDSAPPIAHDDTASTNEDTAVTIDVLSNDSDPDGDPLSVTGTSNGPSNGTITINSDNTITYTPNTNWHGTDHFDYTISDGTGGTATATVTVTVKAVNDAPIAKDDSAKTDVNTSVTIDVLANDTDPDGDTLTIQNLGTPSHGTATISSGKVVYTPDADYNGTDSFTYTVSDGNGGTDTATVAVTIKANQAPVANDVAVTTSKDTNVTVHLDATDPDGDAITSYPIQSGPSHGTLSGAEPDITYTPDSGYSGTDLFTYKACDEHGACSNEATVTITVEAGPIHVDHPSICMESLSYGKKEGLASACFDGPIFKGGPGCIQKLKLRNLSDSPITQSDIDVDYSGFTGVLDNTCGIDGTDETGADCNVSTSPKKAVFNPIGFFDTYRSHTVYLGVLTGIGSSTPFDGTITVNYEQNGTRYTGTLEKCQVASEKSEDLCYDPPVEFGGFMCFQMGDFFGGGLGCSTTIHFRNQGDDTLYNPVVNIITDSMFSGHMIDDCGVDGTSGNCTDSDVLSGPFMGMSGLGMSRTLTYDPLPDFDRNETHNLYSKSLMSAKLFSHTTLLGTYVKNGKLYRGEIRKCGAGDTVYVAGPFDAWDIDRNISDRNISTKIVNEEINLTLASINNTNDGFDTASKECEASLYSLSKHIDLTSPIDYNTTRDGNKVDVTFPALSRADRNVAVRFKFCQDKATKNPVALDYCRNNPIDYEYNTTISSDSFAVRPYAFRIFGNNEYKRAGEEFNLTVKAVDKMNAGLISGEKKQVEGVKDYNVLLSDLTISSSFYVPNEAETRQMNQDVFGLNENNLSRVANCPHSGSFYLADTNASFKDGEINATVSFSETGVLTVSVSETIGKEFAIVDTDDTNITERLIRPALTIDDENEIGKTDLLLFIPYEFNTTAEYKTYTQGIESTQNWLYQSNEVRQSQNSLSTPQMAAYIVYTITAQNKNHQKTKNYTSTCFPDTSETNAPRRNGLKLNSTFDLFLDATIRADRDANISLYSEDNNSKPIWTLNPSKNLNMGINSVQEWISPLQFKDGTGMARVYFNVDRNITKPLNPVALTVIDANTSISWMNNAGATKVFHGYDINITKDFFYACAKPSQFLYDAITSDSTITPVSVVVYCDEMSVDCNNYIQKVAIGAIADAQTNEYEWWLSENHDASVDGSVTIKTTDTYASLGENNSSSYILNFNQGTDNVKVNYIGLLRPHVVDVKLDASGTASWLIYNEKNETVPSPFYRVRFIGTGSGWTGYGKTGHVTGGSMNSEKTRRLEW